MLEIPLGLRHVLETGDCVLFVGAGIGAHLTDANGTQAPDAATLAKELASHFSIETGVYDLAKIAEFVELKKGRTELEAFLHKRLDRLTPDEHLRWLFSLRWKAIFTTNFDYGIERAYELIKEPVQQPVVFTITPDLRPYNPQFNVPVYYLHGTLFGTAKPRIIVTETDYAMFREHRRMLFELLKVEFATSTLLYVGYSNRDPNWKTLLSEMTSEFQPSSLPHSYRIAPETESLEDEILRARGIETIQCTFKEFSETASVCLSGTMIDLNRVQHMRAKIPPDLVFVRK